MRILTIIAALLLVGCASVAPYATPQSERDRAEYLTAGGVWVETQTKYTCADPSILGAPKTT